LACELVASARSSALASLSSVAWLTLRPAITHVWPLRTQVMRFTSPARPIVNVTPYRVAVSPCTPDRGAPLAMA
jgi:hypothetical protein